MRAYTQRATGNTPGIANGHASQRLRGAYARLVSNTTNNSRSGSIHSDVPVQPVWPKLRGPNSLPALLTVSPVGTACHPSARASRRVPGPGGVARVVNCRTVDART